MVTHNATLYDADSLAALDLRVLLAMVVLLALIVVALWVRVRRVEEQGRILRDWAHELPHWFREVSAMHESGKPIPSPPSPREVGR